MLPSELGQAFRRPLGLSNSCQITKGTCYVPAMPPAWSYPLLCFDCEISISWHEPIFSFCCQGRVLPPQCAKTARCGTGQGQTWHEGRGAAQNRDWTLQPFPLESPWSYRPTLAPPVRQREYYTKLPSLRCKPSHLQHISLCSSTAMFDSQSHKLPNRH